MIFGLYTRKEMEREFERMMSEQQRFQSIREEFDRLGREINELHRDMYDLRCRVDPVMRQTPVESCCCKEG